MKTVSGGKFIALSTYIKKLERSQKTKQNPKLIDMPEGLSKKNKTNPNK